MSDGDFGNLSWIAILFLLVQMAQTKPAKMNRINLVGIGRLPCSHDSVNSLREEGKWFQSKISRIKPPNRFGNMAIKKDVIY